MEIPQIPENAQDTRESLDGWLRVTASALLPGVVHGRRADVAAQRDRLAGEWSRARRRGDDVAAAAAAALLTLQDEVLEHLAADEMVSLEPGSVAARLVETVAGSPGQQQSKLADQLGVAPETVSREGLRLEDRGLVVRRRVGRQRLWELTPRGRVAVERLDGTRIPRAGEGSAEPDDPCSEALLGLIDREESQGMRVASPDRPAVAMFSES